MKLEIRTLAALTALALAASCASATSRPHSNSIVVETPSALPVLLQTGAEAMYLHSTGDGRTLLYIETQAGTSLSVLDVSNLARIHSVAQAPLAARGPYDFVQDVGDNGVLIRYRDGSGVALVDLSRKTAPVIVEEPALQHASGAQTFGRTGLLLTSDRALATSPHRLQTYYIMDTEEITRPSLLATVPAVAQQLTRPDTGTLFLLNSNGVTVVRRPALEQADNIAENPHN